MHEAAITDLPCPPTTNSLMVLHHRISSTEITDQNCGGKTNGLHGRSRHPWLSMKVTISRADQPTDWFDEEEGNRRPSRYEYHLRKSSMTVMMMTDKTELQKEMDTPEDGWRRKSVK
ncbi:unnamed protein product [Hymenolepis diminuta]|uniref:Uncharacterized protein n=1 Tax=Hymenolepis diminuta TaxID=6216 RepID=A0A564YSA4_HYMDI|nr:unnamed protein product [Hymenolepis diminuta]VUZ48977.1 unnamed protein product [Hymenolepis diminuta]VUZ50151.1 unnamed protein product [Hymenolepis diminuta]